MDYETLFARLDAMLASGVEIVLRKPADEKRIVAVVRDRRFHTELFRRHGRTILDALVAVAGEESQ